MNTSPEIMKSNYCNYIGESVKNRFKVLCCHKRKVLQSSIKSLKKYLFCS